MLRLNKALRLAVPSPMTIFNQSEWLLIASPFNKKLDHFRTRIIWQVLEPNCYIGAKSFKLWSFVRLIVVVVAHAAVDDDNNDDDDAIVDHVDVPFVVVVVVLNLSDIEIIQDTISATICCSDIKHCDCFTLIKGLSTYNHCVSFQSRLITLLWNLWWDWLLCCWC